MDELMDLLVKDESPNQISDKIKDLLYAKTAEKVTDLRPNVVSNMFDDVPEEGDQDVEKALSHQDVEVEVGDLEEVLQKIQVVLAPLEEVDDLSARHGYMIYREGQQMIHLWYR